MILGLLLTAMILIVGLILVVGTILIDPLIRMLAGLKPKDRSEQLENRSTWQY
jgi:hypothetical protein